MEKLITELKNHNTENLDMLTVMDILKEMNKEDESVILEIRKSLPELEKAINICISNLLKGGRIIYIGAGTSGRLGVLDAAECYPTFGTDKVIGIIAGGEAAFLKAIEGAEDSEELAKKDLFNINIKPSDTVIGIAASGRTPYVIGGLEYANSIGVDTISISCNLNSKISKYSKAAIEVNCGPEILTGSTRLKAGTAQKMILNMISTISMIKIGKVYNNLMVDLVATNKKLEERSKQILIEATGVTYEEAEETLALANGNVKQSIVMLLKNCSLSEAIKSLEKSNGFIRDAIK